MKKAKLQIETPCEKRWDELEGQASKRHCEACSLHVIDGSALTKAEAESVVAEASAADERVCMRMLVDKAGEFVHAAPKEAVTERSPSWGWKAGALFVSGALVACSDEAQEKPETTTVHPPDTSVTVPLTEPPAERPPEILGDVCYVEASDEDPAEEPSDRAADHDDPQHTERELQEMMGATLMLHDPELPADPAPNEPD